MPRQRGRRPWPDTAPRRCAGGAAGAGRGAAGAGRAPRAAESTEESFWIASSHHVPASATDAAGHRLYRAAQMRASRAARERRAAPLAALLLWATVLAPFGAAAADSEDPLPPAVAG